MTTRIITAALFALALTPSVASADHDAGGFDSTAVQVCQDFNMYGPTEVLSVVDDGMGDLLVWLEDVDGDFWACNVNADGDIYANALVTYDLLDGEGLDMLHLVSGAPNRDPVRLAERLCTAAADVPTKVVATVDDGLDGYLIWLKVNEDTFIMCNATPDGALWAFETVGLPINEVPEFAPAIEEMPAEPAPQPIRPGNAVAPTPSQFG